MSLYVGIYAALIVLISIRRTSTESNFSFGTFGTSGTSIFTTEQSSNNLGISLGAQYQFADWIRATTNIGGFYYSSGSRSDINPNAIGEVVNFSSTGFNFRGSSIFFGVDFLF